MSLDTTEAIKNFAKKTSQQMLIYMLLAEKYGCHSDLLPGMKNAVMNRALEEHEEKKRKLAKEQAKQNEKKKLNEKYLADDNYRDMLLVKIDKFTVSYGTHLNIIILPELTLCFDEKHPKYALEEKLRKLKKSFHDRYYKHVLLEDIKPNDGNGNKRHNRNTNRKNLSSKTPRKNFKYY